jgi:hypothetical protein
MKIYRVVEEGGAEVYMGRGSDPFTEKSSAKRRAGQLNNDSKRRERFGYNPTKYKVQEADVIWKDLDV